jgi:hypothetical protein
MDQNSDQHAELAQLYEKSLKEALERLDQIVAETKEMQTAAIEEIIRTKEERQKIVSSAEDIANDVLSAREKEMRSEIHRTLEIDYITKLLRAGRTRAEILSWLDTDEMVLRRVWTSLVGHNTADIDGIVSITQSGRGGTVFYILKEKRLHFYWEFGGNEVLALIFVPNDQTWEAQTGIPLSKRLEILTFVAQQVIRQRASGSIYRILDDVIEIVAV